VNRLACAGRCLRNSAELFLFTALLVCGIHVHPAQAGNAPFHLRIGFSGQAFVNVPKDDIKVAVKVLTRKIAKKSVESAEAHIYDSTVDIDRDLRLKKVDLVILEAEEFIHLRSHEPLEPVMSSVFNKNHEVELLLLVRKNSGINRVSDLKNKSILLPSKTSQFGLIYHTWIETLVMKEGLKSTGDFFSSFSETRNASHAVMPVFFGKSDSCVISRQAFEITSELNPQIGRELKAIAQVGRLAAGIIAFRQDLPEELKQVIRNALLTLHEDQEGRQMFVLFQLSGLIPFRPEYLKGTEALYLEHRKLKGRFAAR
jgi:phosphonate transport system substrate-binding protein